MTGMKLSYLLSLLLVLQTKTTTTFGLNAGACALRFLLNNTIDSHFDLFNTTSAPLILREDSTAILPQAGMYKGPKDIQEYAAFATESSPYFSKGPTSKRYYSNFLGYHETTDICEYLLYFQHEYELNPQYTKDEVSILSYNVTYMLKYRFSYSDAYLKDVYIYYPEPYMQFFFTDMFGNNEKVANYVCEELSDLCNNTLDGEPRETCVSNFLSLPTTTTKQAHIDGNSQGCRAMHAVFARTYPEQHCPHVSLTPMEDPKDQMKCYENGDGYLPSDFFTEEDMAGLREFQIEGGIDPARGYKLAGEDDYLLDIDHDEFQGEEPLSPEGVVGIFGGALGTSAAETSYQLLFPVALSLLAAVVVTGH